MERRYCLEGWLCRLKSVRNAEPAGSSGEMRFTAENRLHSSQEAEIALWPDGCGGARWAMKLREGSHAAAELLYLLYRLAFEPLGLSSLLWVSDGYYTAPPENTQPITPALFSSELAPKLMRQAQEVFREELAAAIGALEFHHIGVATQSIEKELPVYTLMGYTEEGEPFEDPLQGIRGLFITAPGHPRLELLENLPDSHTLDLPLAQRQKLYHTAYYVPDLDRALAIFRANRAKTVSPPKLSVYFGGRICFLMLPNLGMIELMEKPSNP